MALSWVRKCLSIVGFLALTSACGRTTVYGLVNAAVDGGPGVTAAEIDAELLERWNQAEQDVLAKYPGATWYCGWSAVDQFPHPTYRGGNAEAYSSCAEVFVEFIKSPGTLAFLKEHQLLKRPFKGFPTSTMPMTLCELAKELDGSQFVDARRQAMIRAVRPDLGC